MASFNPCFSGTRARTSDQAPGRAGERLVSILVFLELAPGRCVLDDLLESVDLFQSLFFWNSRPDHNDG